MEVKTREFRDSDYQQCEALVNEAWGFDGIFRPRELADIARLIYTRGSVLGSNYRRVVEVDGKVAGFIFGLNELGPKPKKPVLFGLSILWKLLRFKQAQPGDRKRLFKSIEEHDKNRSAIVKRGRSEIVLFVVGRRHKGKGYGKQLWTGFLGHCRASGVKSIIVETNRLGASSFYEQIGFKHIGDFDSPLHAYATPDGQACMYEYRC